MMPQYRRKAFHFFRTHAGGIVGRNAIAAWELTKAEEWADEQGLEYAWQHDDGADLSWCECYKNDHIRHGHDVLGCLLFRPCEEHGVDCKHADHLASLWGIVDPDDNYTRVIEAELALEAMSHEEN